MHDRKLHEDQGSDRPTPVAGSFASSGVVSSKPNANAAPWTFRFENLFNDDAGAGQRLKERWTTGFAKWIPQNRQTAWQTSGKILTTAARWTGVALLAWMAVMTIVIAAYSFINPPASALMAIRAASGAQIKQRWVDIENISPNLVRAVIASEDARFCAHWGIDLREIQQAIKRSRNGIPRGASTLTMQLAKNLFLWPSKSYIRKALEVPLTVLMELFWSKRRIMEIYLNVVEWGPGIFGAEAASRHHFRMSARRLGPGAAALLAVSLPNPIRRRAGKPGRLTRKLAGVIRARARSNRHTTGCVLKSR